MRPDLGEGREPCRWVGDGQIKVGVVGLGAFGRHHARHYAAAPQARLTGVADVDPVRAGQAAADFGGEAVTDHRALIGRVEAVSIATPASDHARIARDFIAAGVHILVEKPIAVDSASAREMIARADEAGTILEVGHIERFSPAIREMKKRIVEARRISAVRRAVWSQRSTDVDVVLDMMIHDIDHVLAFAGAPVASVAASGASVKSETSDEAEAWLTFTNGVVATMSASRVADGPQRKLTVMEPGATYAADLAAPSLMVACRHGVDATAEAIGLSPHDNLAAEIAAFLNSVATGTPPEVDGRAGLAALEVAERIQAAIDEAATPARRRI